MRYIVAIVIAVLTLSYCATANAEGRTPYVFNIGDDSCGKYLAAARGLPPGKGRVIDRPEGQFSDEHHRYSAWLGGFFSATNWWLMDDRNDLQTDNAAVDVWIRKWCEQNPTALLIEAAAAFVWDQRREYLEAGFARQQTK